MDWQEIKVWRKAKRAELVARREALPQAQRHQWNEAITAWLEAGAFVPAGTVVGFCWPFKAEFDPRFAVRHWRDRGAVAALPEVVAKGEPLQFRAWKPGVAMRPGVYDIPVPAETEVVVPDLAIVPMNGCDEQGCRLGYGGGYFDRTLAKWRDRLFAIGVAYEVLRLPTIYPQPHDIPMDLVVTEAGIHRVSGGRLVRIEPEASRDYMQQIFAARRLPRAAPTELGAGYASPACYAAEFPGHWGDASAQKKD